MEGLVRRYRKRFRFEHVSDVASLPLLLLVAGILGFLIQPLQMAFGRYREHEADRFALEITRDNYAGATAFVELARTNLGNPDPGPLFRLFRASHPVPADRIEFANDYRPWETGSALRYGHLMRREP
jgi:Zn-dependent protease with chaperone function